MATYDNKHWLLSHVRDSFISTDDTGMCELVMVSEDLPKLLRASRAPEATGLGPGPPPPPPDELSEEPLDAVRLVSEFDCYPEMEYSDEEDHLDPLADSYDLQHDIDFGIHRQRSNTAQRLEKMDHAQKKAAKTRIIKWEGPNNNMTEHERDQLFSKKHIKNKTFEGRKSKTRSLLTEQLEKSPNLPKNKFLEYAMFDGTFQCGSPTKTYKIFMTMLPEELRNYPITVCVIGSAKIKDLIGFTCYKYSMAHPDVVLSSVSNYDLHICEDDGEVDVDFPCLEANEACSKFGFNYLGIVDSKLNAVKSTDIRTSSIPDKGGFSSISLPEDSKNEDKDVQSEHKDKSKNLNKLNNENKSSIRTDSIINKVNSVQFKPLELSDSENSSLYGEYKLKLPDKEEEALNRMKLHELSIEAPLYQSYTVQLVNRVRANTHVALGISGEKIEIEPLIRSSQSLWFKTKPMSFSISCIERCILTEAKNTRTSFRIYVTYERNAFNRDPNSSSGSQALSSSNSNSFARKCFYFESEHTIAKEIVEKINMILELKLNASKKELIVSRQKIHFLRRSFHLPKANT